MPLRDRLPALGKVAGVFTAVIGYIVILGWALNIQWLVCQPPNKVPMDPVSALGFVLAGSALWRLAEERRTTGPSRDLFAMVFAAVVVLLGMLKLADYLFEIGLQLERLLFVRTLAAMRVQPLVEVTPNVALGLILGGGGLLLMDFETRRGFRPAQALAFLAGLLALLALIACSYRWLSMFRVGSNVPMSLSTAIGLGTLSLGILAARPDRGMMNVVTSPTTGGAVARRLLPMAILIPWILGGLRLIGEESGYFQAEFGVSSFAVSSIVVFTILIWWNAKLLHQADRERASIQRRLAVQYSSTRVLAEAENLPQAFPRILQAVCETLGWQVAAMWLVDPDGQKIRCVESWHRTSPPKGGSPNLHEFVQATRLGVLRRSEGLPGRVWATGEPAWIADVVRDANFPRADRAQNAGLHGAFAFPIRLGKEVFGVMEFFSHKTESPDETLLQMVSALGSQIGQFIERHRAEEQLRQTSTNLERSNRDLQQFAYVASHDLSEPLRMVHSYLGLLKDHVKGKLDAESLEFIGYAQDGAMRMQTLINDLLAYSRVDSGGRAFQSTNCEQVLSSALSNLKVAIQETKANVSHDELPVVKADPTQLSQVFQNLIGNAIKFHGADPPRIHVRAEARDGEWVFTVRDSGIGIDPQYFERIFVIFQRLHTRQEYPGTGMGLAICKRIIERHGGRIWVESNPGRGSTFFFTLPKKEEEVT